MGIRMVERVDEMFDNFDSIYIIYGVSLAGRLFLISPNSLLNACC
jgi:hypothetical protein